MQMYKLILGLTLQYGLIILFLQRNIGNNNRTMRIIRRIARLFMLPLLKNGVFFVTMYILGILCAYLTLPDNDNAEVYDNLGLELFLDLYAGCVVLALLPRKVRLWVCRCLYLILLRGGNHRRVLFLEVRLRHHAIDAHACG